MTNTLPEDMRERVRDIIGYTLPLTIPDKTLSELENNFMNLVQEVRRKAQLGEEHYWIDRYSREIKSLDGSEPIELRERNCLKDIRRQHQNRAIELQSLNKESKNE